MIDIIFNLRTYINSDKYPGHKTRWPDKEENIFIQNNNNNNMELLYKILIKKGKRCSGNEKKRYLMDS